MTRTDLMRIPSARFFPPPPSIFSPLLLLPRILRRLRRGENFLMLLNLREAVGEVRSAPKARAPRGDSNNFFFGAITVLLRLATRLVSRGKNGLKRSHMRKGLTTDNKADFTRHFHLYQRGVSAVRTTTLHRPQA